MRRWCQPCLLIGLLLIALALQPAQAQTSVTPTQYGINMTQVEYCRDADCTSTKVYGVATKDYDIAAANASEEVGSYPGELTADDSDSFTHIRVSLTREFRVTGATTTALANAGGAGVSAFCHTDADDTTSSATAAGRAGTAATAALAAAAAGSQILVVPNVTGSFAGDLTTAYSQRGIAITGADSMTVTGELDDKLVVTKGEPVPSADAAFDVSNKLVFQVTAAGVCSVFLDSPNVTYTVVPATQ